MLKAQTKILKWASIIDAVKPICWNVIQVQPNTMRTKRVSIVYIAQPNYDSLKNGTISIGCLNFYSIYINMCMYKCTHREERLKEMRTMLQVYTYIHALQEINICLRWVMVKYCWCLSALYRYKYSSSCHLCPCVSQTRLAKSLLFQVFK